MARGGHSVRVQRTERIIHLEVLREIREQPELRKLIVVVMTSSDADSDNEQAYDLGANSYLSKPNGLEGFQGLADAIGHYWLGRNKIASSRFADCVV
jgi:CheY-like chemotaxis protein